MRDRSLARRAAAAVLAGVLYAAAQPGFGLWPLAPICLLPLLLAWRGATLHRRLLLGWLAGTTATALATAAAGATGAERYFGLAGPAALAASLAVGQLFGAASFVLFALLAGDPARRGPLAAAARSASALAAAELARGTLLTGFPWLLLAYALLPAPSLAQLASALGAVGVSLLLALANAALAELVARGRSERQRVRAGLCAAGALLLLAAPGSFGATSGGSVRGAAGGSAPGALRWLLVQHAPAAERRSAPAEALEAVASLRALTRGRPDFDVALWSENALPALLPENAHLLRGALPEDGRERALLLGAPRSDPARPGTLHTSAFLTDREGRVVAVHDKVKLLPFAEYAPWPFAPGAFGIGAAAPGEAPRVLPWRGGAFGPLICYEVLFAGLARRLASEGAGVLVNLSNDAWFGDTGAAEQHLAASMYRAIETRRPLLRATHTGITAAVDARGNVVARLPVDVPGTLAVDVAPGRGTTPYVRFGDAPLGALLLAGLGLTSSRRRRPPSRLR